MRRKFRSENHCAFFAHGVANAEISVSDRRRARTRTPGRIVVQSMPDTVTFSPAAPAYTECPSARERVDHLERPEAQRLQRLAVMLALGLRVADDAAPVDRDRVGCGRFGTPPSDVFTCATVPRCVGAPAPSACSPRPDVAQVMRARRAPRARRSRPRPRSSSPTVTVRVPVVGGHASSRAPLQLARRSCRAALIAVPHASAAPRARADPARNVEHGLRLRSSARCRRKPIARGDVARVRGVLDRRPHGRRGPRSRAIAGSMPSVIVRQIGARRAQRAEQVVARVLGRVEPAFGAGLDSPITCRSLAARRVGEHHEIAVAVVDHERAHPPLHRLGWLDAPRRPAATMSS